jgi:hypothetical protein
MFRRALQYLQLTYGRYSPQELETRFAEYLVDIAERSAKQS